MGVSNKYQEIPPGTRAILYLRHNLGDSRVVEAQELALRQICEEEQWGILEVFIDHCVSGGDIHNNTSLKRLLHFVEQRQHGVELVVVWSLAAFSRNMSEAIAVFQKLMEFGVQIYSMTEDISISGLHPMVAAIFNLQNQHDIDQIRETTKQGLRHIAEQGYLPGGRIIPGYVAKKVALTNASCGGKPRVGRKPEIDPEVGPLVIQAFEMKANGALHRTIAKETALYAPQSSAWSRFFRNRSYIGEYEFGGVVYTNIYPPLISCELFETVQKQISPKKTDDCRN